MTFPVEGNDWWWTAPFHQVRNPGKKNEHVHGAQDLACTKPVRELAMFAGDVYYHKICVHRGKESSYHAYGTVKWLEGRDYPFANYRMDVYGICAVLVRRNPAQMWVYAHLDPESSQFWDSMARRDIDHEQDNENFTWGWIVGPKPVEKGQPIGVMGYTGYCLSADPENPHGRHLHQEGHRGLYWNDYHTRINLEQTELSQALRRRKAWR